VNIVLESCGCVCEAKGYDSVFEVPITRSKSYFLFIPFLNTNIVIGILDIDLAKDPSAREAI
jgi:hypothetical protein